LNYLVEVLGLVGVLGVVQVLGVVEVVAVPRMNDCSHSARTAGETI
jgi:hypothetical protein